MNTKTRNWLHGLIGGFVGGMAGAIDSALALMVLVPEQFNLSKDLGRTLITALVLGLLTGIKCAFAYLKQSPLPLVSTGNTELITKPNHP
jgi:hypothetical protein